MKLRSKPSRLRRWLCSALSVGKPMNAKTRLVFALLIFTLSLSTKSLHAVDQAPLMYTTQQELGELVDAYDSRASSIIQGDGLLGPYYSDVRNTSPLARAPGYPICLSVLYSIFGRDHFRVQLIQNVLNSISPILIFIISGLLVSWHVGVVSGLLAAVSHHLSAMSNWLLPDSLPAFFLLVAVYLFLIARRSRPYAPWLYILAGTMIGVSAWLRPLTMLLGLFFVLMLALISVRRWQAVRYAALMTLGSFLVIAPITLNNYLRYGEFVPMNIHLGLLLWVGIADVSGDRFGAVPDDNEVAWQEALIYNNPSYGQDWSSPDGIQRDRDRVKKSLLIIANHPLWYAGVMADRMGDMVKYSAHAPLIQRSRKEPPEEPYKIRGRWQSELRNESSLAIGASLSWLRLPIRAMQRITKESMPGFILLGAAILFLVSWRRSLFLLIVPLYHLLFQSFMHTEFRYGLPIHYFLFVFAAIAWVLLITMLWKGLAKIKTHAGLGQKADGR